MMDSGLLILIAFLLSAMMFGPGAHQSYLRWRERREEDRFIADVKRKRALRQKQEDVLKDYHL